MEIVQEKILKKDIKLNSLKSISTHRKVDPEKQISNLVKYIDNFNDLIHTILLKIVWVENPKKVDETIKKTIAIKDKVLFKKNEILTNPHKILIDDQEISFGLFNDRMNELVKRLNFVKDRDVPIEEYIKLSWEDKIRSFAILNKNWDSNGSPKIPKTRIISAVKFLIKHFENEKELKMVYPSMYGTVGLIYEIDKCEVNILFLANERLEINITNESCDELFHNQINSKDITNLSNIIRFKNE